MLDARRDSVARFIGGNISLTPDIPDNFPFQCFIGSNHSHLTEEKLAWVGRFGRRFDGKPTRMIHAGYVTYPWAADENTTRRSISDIHHSSVTANRLGIWGLNVHLPKEYHLIDGFHAHLDACFKALEPPCVMLFELVGSSTALVGEGKLPKLPFDRLRECQPFIEEAAKKYRKEWGFCIDTSHAFVQGQRISTANEATESLKMLDLLNVKAMHLNGSKFPFNSGKDQHTGVGFPDDFIWARDATGLVEIVKWGVEKKMPIILERSHQTLPEDYSTEKEKIIELVLNKRNPRH